MDTITADVRYNFTAQFLHGAAIFARHAHAIDTQQRADISEDTIAEHRAYVVAAVLHAAAALDADVSTVIMYGPGHHLGSNGTDTAARDQLWASGIINKQPYLRRYDRVLRLLGKPPLNADVSECARLLIDLRNELVHYKSKWGADMEKEDLFRRLEGLRLAEPQFTAPSMNFFPHRCLSASLASWAVITGATFLNDFYSKLAIASPLVDYTDRLAIPPPRQK